MPDKEKAIKALELCDIGSDNMCYETDCPYYQEGCTEQLKNDLLVLLNEQEPRVMILEEVLGGDECWFEYINGSCGYADVYMQDNKTAIIYRTNMRPGEVLITDYMKKWRCWSYRPTDEQRKAVNWDA